MHRERKVEGLRRIMMWILLKAELKKSRLKWFVSHTFGREHINIVQ